MPGPIFSMPNRFIWTDSPPKKMWHIVCNMLRWWISWYIEWLYKELTSNYHELASKSVLLVVVHVPVFLALLPLRSPAPSPCAASRRLVALLPTAARSSAHHHAHRPPPCATVRVLLGPQPRGLSSSTSGTLPFAMVLRSQESKEPPDIKEVRTAWGGA